MISSLIILQTFIFILGPVGIERLIKLPTHTPPPPVNSRPHTHLGVRVPGLRASNKLCLPVIHVILFSPPGSGQNPAWIRWFQLVTPGDRT